jgi:hypothetical protein
MTPGGRFGHLLAQAMEKKGITLSVLATKIDYTYEQCRKLYIGTSSPSPLLLKEFCKVLDMSFVAADAAATVDRMERRYGKIGMMTLGLDPRLSALNAVAAVLTDTEIATLVTVAQGLINSRKRA